LKELSKEEKKADFVEVLKSAYDKGLHDKEMTVEKILEELKLDLKSIMTI
jgi:hypothetical protein